jgi:site-specific recombinase XerD
MKYHSRKRTQFFYVKRESMKTKKAKPVSLETAFEGFLEACKARALSVHTVEDYSRTIKMFIRYAGNIIMNDVTSRHITGFLASLYGVGAKTILNRHIGLAAFWTWALKQEPSFVDRHVVRLVDKPRPKRILIDPFSEVEVRALLSVMRNKPVRDRAIIYLLLDTGMRASELVGIERKDINFTANKVKVLGKGNKERLLPFSDRTAKALSRHLASTVGTPFPFSRTTLTSIVARLGERASVNECYPHRFRHTFAIEYLRNNGDPYTLQFSLDHSTMTMVSRYVKIAQIDIDRVHRKASPVENWRL